MPETTENMKKNLWLFKDYKDSLRNHINDASRLSDIYELNIPESLEICS